MTGQSKAGVQLTAFLSKGGSFNMPPVHIPKTVLPLPKNMHNRDELLNIAYMLATCVFCLQKFKFLLMQWLQV